MLELCRQLEIEVVLPEREVEKHALGDEVGIATIVPLLEDVQVGLCIALGGDGTILRAFNRFPDMQTPVLGVNFGRVGFLSAINPDEIGSRLRSILEGRCEILDLSLIELDNGGEKALAVNDVVVHKSDGGSVVRLGYGIVGGGDGIVGCDGSSSSSSSSGGGGSNGSGHDVSDESSAGSPGGKAGVEFGSLSCDGMVLATPAGSTAYNLSNGGPLVSLSLEAMVLTAIAPHTLQFRSLVIGPREQLFIRNETTGQFAAIYIDGRPAGSLVPEGLLNLSIALRKAHLVQPPGADFYRTLRDRFIQPQG